MACKKRDISSSFAVSWVLFRCTLHLAIFSGLSLPAECYAQSMTETERQGPILVFNLTSTCNGTDSGLNINGENIINKSLSYSAGTMRHEPGSLADRNTARHGSFSMTNGTFSDVSTNSSLLKGMDLTGSSSGVLGQQFSNFNNQQRQERQILDIPTSGRGLDPLSNYTAVKDNTHSSTPSASGSHGVTLGESEQESNGSDILQRQVSQLVTFVLSSGRSNPITHFTIIKDDTNLSRPDSADLTRTALVKPIFQSAGLNTFQRPQRKLSAFDSTKNQGDWSIAPETAQDLNTREPNPAMDKTSPDSPERHGKSKRKKIKRALKNFFRKIKNKTKSLGKRLKNSKAWNKVKRGLRKIRHGVRRALGKGKKKEQNIHSAGEPHGGGWSEFQLKCLEAHDHYRAKHGVPRLKLRKDLCDSSQRYANILGQTDPRERMEHSQRGENLSVTGRDVVITPKSVVGDWYDEINNYNFDTTWPYDESKDYGHFTQLIWRETTHVCCGQATGGSGAKYVVCHYDPPGNGRFKSNQARAFQENVPRPHHR